MYWTILVCFCYLYLSILSAYFSHHRPKHTLNLKSNQKQIFRSVIPTLACSMGGNCISMSSTTSTTTDKVIIQCLRKQVQSLFCFLTLPPQLNQSFLCLMAFWYIEIYSVTGLSDTQDIILPFNACKLAALLVLDTVQWTVEVFEP